MGPHRRAPTEFGRKMMSLGRLLLLTSATTAAAAALDAAGRTEDHVRPPQTETTIKLNVWMMTWAQFTNLISGIILRVQFPGRNGTAQPQL